ncbi:MAG TPA: hypothetical protein DDW17_02735 [Deltaproteobacteria bacterium]|nr:hypothetical protein [Deltaproteobacteria bacterium]
MGNVRALMRYQKLRGENMKKVNRVEKLVLLAVLVIGLVVIGGCGKGPEEKPGVTQMPTKSQKEAKKASNAIENVCGYFPKELVESAIGKPIVKTEGRLPGMGDSCYYYTSYSEKYRQTQYGYKPGGSFIVVVYDTKDFAKDRAYNEKSGTKYESDPSIGMDNFVMRNKINEIWQTALVLGGDRYIRIKSIDKAVPGEDLVKIARKFAERIRGDSSLDLSSKKSEMDKGQVIGESQQAVVTNFFNNLSALKIQNALAMMDANENTKQAWGINFNTIESLKVNKIEEVYKEEWTSTRQSFKVKLEVKVKPAGEQIGWQNGINYRWITLEKNAKGQWLVHEIANNP